MDSSEAAEHWDVYASMFGGIPAAELDELSAYWAAFPALRGELFAENGTPYAALTVEDIKSAIKNSRDVTAFEDAYRSAFAALPAYMKDVLLNGMDKIEIAKTETTLSEDIFARLADIPLIDKYEAYQLLDDHWNTIAVDLEMIQTEGFGAAKKGRPPSCHQKEGQRGAGSAGRLGRAHSAL